MMENTAKKKLFIIGAGDFGREMESWLLLLPDFNKNWIIVGYLDNNMEALNGFPSDYKVIGNPLEYEFAADDFALMCVTNPSDKQYLVENLREKVNFFSFIAPTAIIGKYTKIGEGCIILFNSIISANVVMGDFVTINVGSQIGHDCIIGSFCSLMSSVDLGGCVKLGERVFMGTNSTIIPRRSVADNILIGAGSIVFKNLSKPGTYLGNPATLLRF